MALKTCRECGHKVSSEAKVCPNCGVKEPYQSPVRGLIFIAIVIIASIKDAAMTEVAQVIPITQTM